MILGLRDHRVQIHEVARTDAGKQGETEVQHLFAAVTCSKRCAVAVLTAEIPAEDAERASYENLFNAGSTADPS